MARSKSSSRRDIAVEIDSLKEQLESLAALVDRYRDDKDISVAADVVAKARDFIARARQATTNAAEQSIDTLVDAGQEAVGVARSTASEAIDDLGATLARNPLTAAAAAAGLGLVVGLMMRRD
ncbi:MAG: hypothetical protein JNK67_22835 [Alphaproteobacteria bacterium]|nr:hypothetical protein [Alphaproteobacteria bacterium]